MNILHKNSALAVNLVKFFGKPMYIKTLFSNIDFSNKTIFFIQNNNFQLTLNLPLVKTCSVI